MQLERPGFAHERIDLNFDEAVLGRRLPPSPAGQAAVRAGSPAGAQ